MGDGLAGRAAIGAGRGHALAREDVTAVVNDRGSVGGKRDGTADPAAEIVQAVKDAAGGRMTQQTTDTIQIVDLHIPLSPR